MLRKYCLVIHFTEGNKEGGWGRRRRRRQIPDELKEKVLFWKWKNEVTNQHRSYPRNRVSVNVELKGKFNLEQITKAQRESRDIALLCL